MSRRLLVDSDVLIDYLRERRGVDVLFDQFEEDDLAVSRMSYAELLVGELYSYEFSFAKSRIERLLSGYLVYPIDEATLDRYAELNWILRRQGKKSPPAISLLPQLLWCTDESSSPEISGTLSVFRVFRSLMRTYPRATSRQLLNHPILRWLCYR